MEVTGRQAPILPSGLSLPITARASTPVLDVQGEPLPTLAAGATDATTFTATHVLTQEDVDHGLVLAQSEVAGMAPDGRIVMDLSDDPTHPAENDHNGDGIPDDPVETLLPQREALGLEKVGDFGDENGDGFADPGETIPYTFTITNTGNVTLHGVTPKDDGPRFGGAAPSGVLSAFEPGPVTLTPGASQVFTAVYTLTEQDLARVMGVEEGVVNRAGAEGLSVTGKAAPPPRAEMVLTTPGVTISKRAELAEVQRGARVPYLITLKPLNLRSPTTVSVIDVMPVGFTYLPGTASVAGAAVEPAIEGRLLVFEGIEVVPLEPIEIRLSLGASAAVQPGRHVNRARAIWPDGTVLTRDAVAEIEVVTEPVFDCGDVIGKVFEDENRDGYQDQGEPGLAGVRIATVNGLLVSTDRHGRFHVACADLPDPRIGSNYIMKLDPHTLPSGYRLTTENPRTVRLTAGKAVRVNFGATHGRVVRIDVNDAAFQPGTTDLRPEWWGEFLRIVDVLDREESVLRLSYVDANADRRLAIDRTRRIRRTIAQLWRAKPGRYRLNIETHIETRK